MKVWDPAALGLQIVRVSGVEAKLRCPFHFDQTPSAMFNLTNGLFHCFGCGHSANVYQLVKEFGGELLKIELSLIPHFDEPDHEWRNLSLSKLANRNKYLQSRGVTIDQINNFSIMRHKEGILFPIFDKRGLMIGIQERRYYLEPKYMLHGERTPVWPMKNLKYENLLLVEGVFGVLRAEKYGYNAVCTMGASAIPQAAKVLEGHNVKIVFDNDLAGHLGAYSFMRLHSTSSVYLPGTEVDEADEKEFSEISGFVPTRDIMGYAMKLNDAKLINAIKKKEEQYGKKNSWQTSRSPSRKTRLG